MLQGDEQVLDAATGTGVAALNLAFALSEGRVTAVDLSEGMLAEAKAKAISKNIQNIDFLLMDIENLGFSENTFDHVNCSFGLFFVEDMHSLLNELVKRLRQGGKMVSCCFSEDSFQPHTTLFFNRIMQYGVELPTEIGYLRLGDEQKSTAFYETANLKNITTYRYDLSFKQKNAEEWWSVLWYAGYRGFLGQLSEEELSQFKAEHLREISALSYEDGIQFNVSVIFTVGEK